MLTPAFHARLFCLLAAVVGGCADAHISPLAGPGQLPQGGLFLGCPDYDEEKKLPELANESTVEAGANHGSFSVSSAGEANFSMPIAVPPGRAEKEPWLFFKLITFR